jgi:hypothetical protein
MHKIYHIIFGILIKTFYLYIVNQLKKNMSQKAKFVKEVVVDDPDTRGEVHLAVYKHENGGMFAIDSSYIEQVLDPEDDGPMSIPDPFDRDGLQTLFLEE